MNSPIGPNLSARDRNILKIAKMEADPIFAHRFEPITLGPLISLIGLFSIGLFSPFYLVYSKLIKFYEKKF